MKHKISNWTTVKLSCNEFSGIALTVKIHVLKYIEDQKCSIICYLQVLCHTTVDIFLHKFGQIQSKSTIR